MHNEVVTVAMSYCDESLTNIYRLVEQNHQEADRHIIINFGVAAGRGEYSLEL